MTEIVAVRCAGSGRYAPASGTVRCPVCGKPFFVVWYQGRERSPDPSGWRVPEHVLPHLLPPR